MGVYNLQKALSVAIKVDVTTEQAALVRREFASGLNDEDINMTIFMSMMDYLEPLVDRDLASAEYKKEYMSRHEHRQVTERGVSVKICPHRDLLGIEKDEVIVENTGVGAGAGVDVDDDETEEESSRSQSGFDDFDSPTAQNQSRHNYDDDMFDAQQTTNNPQGRNAENTQRGFDDDFESVYRQDQMRCLALVAHGQMKETLRQFVVSYKHTLKKFRLTGNNSVMTMLEDIYREDDGVIFGPWCGDDGLVGGDAELAALMSGGKLGGIILFEDHSQSSYEPVLESLCHYALIHNTMIVNNPTTALMVMNTCRIALEEGRAELIPSFFFSLCSPSTVTYQAEQEKGKEYVSEIDELENTLAIANEERQKLQNDELKNALARANEENQKLQSEKEKLKNDLKNEKLASVAKDKELASIMEGIVEATPINAVHNSEVRDCSFDGTESNLSSSLSMAITRHANAGENLFEALANMVQTYDEKTETGGALQLIASSLSSSSRSRPRSTRGTIGANRGSQLHIPASSLGTMRMSNVLRNSIVTVPASNISVVTVPACARNHNVQSRGRL